MKVKNVQPRIPKQQRSVQTKRQIIDAAMRLFSQKGFHGTNSKEIAREAGVATGCFYAYFSDKKEVFIEALKIYFEQFSAITQTHISELISKSDDTKIFLKETIHSFIDAHGVFTDLHHELIAMYYTDPDVQKLVSAYKQANIGYIQEYLKKIQSQLRVTNLEAAAELIYWSIHNVVDAIASSKMDHETLLIDELTDMIAMYLFGKSNTPFPQP